MSFAMTKAEREAFLADVHVGVMSVTQEGRGPLTVPVWYAYEPGGEVVFVTADDARKTALLRQAGRFSLCAQIETPPYKYVSVEGPITSIDTEGVQQMYHQLARRYLGPEEGDAYIERNGGDTAGEASLLIRMRPEHWFTVDYGKE